MELPLFVAKNTYQTADGSLFEDPNLAAHHAFTLLISAELTALAQTIYGELPPPKLELLLAAIGESKTLASAIRERANLSGILDNIEMPAVTVLLAEPDAVGVTEEEAAAEASVEVTAATDEFATLLADARRLVSGDAPETPASAFIPDPVPPPSLAAQRQARDEEAFVEEEDDDAPLPPEEDDAPPPPDDDEPPLPPLD